MRWGVYNVTKLRVLWDQGLPTAQLGQLLGFTKNAVAGIAHRIRLERRPSPIRRTAVMPDTKESRSPVMPKLNFESAKEPEIVSTEPAVFQPLVKNIFTAAPKRGCEWPEGHPDEADFRFCGKDRFEDKPYCLDHCAVAYVVPEKEENEKTELNNTI